MNNEARHEADEMSSLRRQLAESRAEVERLMRERDEAVASRDSYLKYTQPAVLRRAEAADELAQRLSDELEQIGNAKRAAERERDEAELACQEQRHRAQAAESEVMFTTHERDRLLNDVVPWWTKQADALTENLWAAERERDDLVEHCTIRDQQMEAAERERDRYKALVVAIFKTLQRNKPELWRKLIKGRAALAAPANAGKGG